MGASPGGGKTATKKILCALPCFCCAPRLDSHGAGRAVSFRDAGTLAPGLVTELAPKPTQLAHQRGLSTFVFVPGIYERLVKFRRSILRRFVAVFPPHGERIAERRHRLFGNGNSVPCPCAAPEGLPARRLGGVDSGECAYGAVTA